MGCILENADSPCFFLVEGWEKRGEKLLLKSLNVLILFFLFFVESILKFFKVQFYVICKFVKKRKKEGGEKKGVGKGAFKGF